MQNTSKSKMLSDLKITRNFGKALFFVFFLLLISSTFRCANIQQPMGGPIDSIPPKLLNELPENLKTNFSDRKIVLTFDEFIRLNNASKEISISPDMDQFPEFKAKRKQLEVLLPDSLAENTTYLINFGRAIVDNNEGNPLLDYTYVFSTGDKIDSLSISGKVYNASTNEPEALISVILLPISQDSLFGKRKANIFTTTDSSGNFKLNYLRPDSYRIYALKEQNNDRIYNSPEEWIGFLPDSINLEKDTSNIVLWTSKEQPASFRVMDRKIEANGKVVLAFNKSLEDPSIRITDPDSLNTNKLVLFNQKKDSAAIWLQDLSFDSLKMSVFSGDNLLDSILIRRARNDRYDRKILLNDNMDRNRVNRTKHLALYSTIPLAMVDRSKIKLEEDSVTITNYQLLRDTLNSENLSIRYNWKPNKNYQLIMEPGALIGHFNETNEQMIFLFTLDESDRYGHLSLHFELPDTNSQYIVELIDEDNTKVLDSRLLKSTQKIEYKNYLEGKYRIKVSYDSNHNGKWDPGNLKEGLQPEFIWFFDKTFNIRPNWEQEETINIPPTTSPRQMLPPPRRR